MEKFLRRPYLPGICEGAEVPHQCGPVGRKGMEELLKFFLDLQSASLHSGLSSFCPYSYAIPCAHMQIEETVTSRVGAYGEHPPGPRMRGWTVWGSRRSASPQTPPTTDGPPTCSRCPRCPLSLPIAARGPSVGWRLLFFC